LHNKDNIFKKGCTTDGIFLGKFELKAVKQLKIKHLGL